MDSTRKLIFYGRRAGCSTFFKHLTYSQDQIPTFRDEIYMFILQSLFRFACLQAQTKTAVRESATQVCRTRLLRANSHKNAFDPQILQHCVALIKEPQFALWTKNLPDGMHHLVKRLTTDQDILQADYVPTFEDVLHTYKLTPGYKQKNVQIGSQTINIVDIGHQASLPYVQQHCAEGSVELAYVVALGEYYCHDCVHTMLNSMRTSLDFLGKLCNGEAATAFKRIYIIFNKVDKFMDNFYQFPLETYFPEYQGGNNIKLALDYIIQKFIHIIKTSNASKSSVSIHFTTAIDPKTGPWLLELLQYGQAKDPVEIPCFWVLSKVFTLLMTSKSFTDLQIYTTN